MTGRRALGALALAAALGGAVEPPPEVLDDLEFFLSYDLVKELDALLAAPAPEVHGSTEPVRRSTPTAVPDPPKEAP